MLKVVQYNTVDYSRQSQYSRVNTL